MPRVQVENQPSPALLALIIPGYGAHADEDQVTELLGEHGGFLGARVDRHGHPLNAKCLGARNPAPGLLC